MNIHTYCFYAKVHAFMCVTPACKSCFLCSDSITKNFFFSYKISIFASSAIQYSVSLRGRACCRCLCFGMRC